MGMTKTSAHRRPFTPLPTLGRDAAKVSNEPRVSDAARSTNVSFGGDRRNCVFLEAPPKALQSVRGARYHGNPARMYAMIFQISSSVSASLKAGISVPKR